MVVVEVVGAKGIVRLTFFLRRNRSRMNLSVCCSCSGARTVSLYTVWHLTSQEGEREEKRVAVKDPTGQFVKRLTDTFDRESTTLCCFYYTSLTVQ